MHTLTLDGHYVIRGFRRLNALEQEIFSLCSLIRELIPDERLESETLCFKGAHANFFFTYDEGYFETGGEEFPISQKEGVPTQLIEDVHTDLVPLLDWFMTQFPELANRLEPFVKAGSHI